MLSNRNRNSLQSSVRPENVGGLATPRRSTRRAAASINVPGLSLTTRCPASTSILPSKYSFASPPKTHARTHQAGRG
eukprot:4123013-Heterocapsa_arctica.AAC.1